MRSTVEQARFGLRFLFEGLDDYLKGPYAHERNHLHAHLPVHPFELEMSLHGLSNQNVRLVADPGHTATSVRGMILMLQEQLKEYSSYWSENKPFRMRIVKVEQEVTWKHNLYFELITYEETFLAGGCNDYAGEGGCGGRQLTAIFDMVSFFHKIAVEEVNISHRKGAPAEKALQDAYNQFMMGKEESAA